MHDYTRPTTITPSALDELVTHVTTLIATVRTDPEHGYYVDMASDMVEDVLIKFGLVKPRPVAVMVPVLSGDEVEF